VWRRGERSRVSHTHSASIRALRRFWVGAPHRVLRASGLWAVELLVLCQRHAVELSLSPQLPHAGSRACLCLPIRVCVVAGAGYVDFLCFCSLRCVRSGRVCQAANDNKWSRTRVQMGSGLANLLNQLICPGQGWLCTLLTAAAGQLHGASRAIGFRKWRVYALRQLFGCRGLVARLAIL
jgi:hypothetical protein